MIRQPSPRSLEITTRIGCQNMCRFCPQNLLINEYSKREGELFMSFKTFKTCIDKVPKSVRIDFSGMAEPWLNKNCTRMLLYAHKQGFKNIAVFTTGVGMNLSDLRKISHVPFSVFYVHLADSKGNSKIKITQKYLTLLKEIKRLDIKNKRFMAMGKLHPKLKSLFGNLVEPVKMISRAGNLNFINKINKSGSIKCCWPEGLKHNGLLPNGDVLLCSMDYGITRPIGNLLRNKYEDLFKSKEFKNIVQILKGRINEDIICRHCEYVTENPDISMSDKIYNFLHKHQSID